MARTRRPLARGTKSSSGIESGVTWATNPSGVTMDYQGITTSAGLITAAELDYLTGAVGYVTGNPAAAKLCVSGVSYWAGTTVTLNTGLTSIDHIMTCVINDGIGTQPLIVHTSNVNNNPGCASASLWYNLGTAGVSLARMIIAPGCSISFIAFGT